MNVRWFVLVPVLAALACRPAAPPPEPPQAPETSRPPVPEVVGPTLALDQVAAALARLASDPHPVPGLRRTVEEAESLARLYAISGGGLLWLTAGGSPRPVAREALTLLLDSDSEGLRPADYAAVRLDSLAGTLGGDSAAALPAARFDVGLSLAMLRYFRHLHRGRVDPQSLRFQMSRADDRHDVVALLGSALSNEAIFETAADLAPQFRQYGQLRQALARYRALAADETADSVRLDVPVHPGDTVPGLAGLVRRLEVNGDLVDQPADTAVYGAEIAAALRNFQARHGLEADGVIGKETIAELNVRLDWRVHQLDLSLERLRWLPDLRQGRFLLVNIPMFELYAFDSIGPGSTPALRMDVIVGKALSTETPIFAEEMRYVIFQPYWNVPPSILRGEILPALRKDSTYLRKQDMEIVQGPGDDAAPLAQSPENLARLGDRQLRVRQRPGPRNSLGPLKFMFPNDENIYLHGTPAQELFSRHRRDFSHGCVRVEDPAVLAAYVLRDLPEWNLERIREAMTTGARSRRVNLPQTLPVLLFYTTAAVMPDGTIRFARDIYGHDRRLDAALHGGGSR